MNIEQEREWEAWKEMAKLWPGDINEPHNTSLVKAIRYWGECLAVLRYRQSSEELDRALNAARKGVGK